MGFSDFIFKKLQIWFLDNDKSPGQEISKSFILPFAYNLQAKEIALYVCNCFLWPYAFLFCDSKT